MALLIYRPGKKYIICIWCKILIKTQQPHSWQSTPSSLWPPTPTPTAPSVALFLWLNGWLRHILCAILLKACAHYFLFFHQMIAIQKLWKMLFISCKNSFHSQDIQIFVFPSSPPFDLVGHCFSGWLKKNLKGYDVINFISWVGKKAWHRNFVHTLSIK